MINKLTMPDTMNSLDFPIATKLNEVIDYLNQQAYEQKKNEICARLALEQEKLGYETRDPRVVPGYAAHLKPGEIIERPDIFSKEGIQAMQEYLPPKYREECCDTIKPKPKWKVGDKFYYLETRHDVKLWFVKESEIVEICNNFYLNQLNQGKELGIFKTKEQAEQALSEIKQVMEKYQ